jgi:hypothetical protein
MRRAPPGTLSDATRRAWHVGLINRDALSLVGHLTGAHPAMSDTLVQNRNSYRRLDKLRHVPISGRILNLIQLEKNLGEDNRTESTPGSVDRRKGPARFFSNDILNHAIYIKHNLRREEERLFASHNHVETKVFIPFARERLEIGGQSFFIGEVAYTEILGTMLQFDANSSDAKTQRDLKVLSILRTVPSFDPFILRERLRSGGIKVDRRYFLGSYFKIKTATEAVFADIRPLIESALGKRATHEELSRFVDQVWNVTDRSTSNLFFETLRIPRTEWPDIVFAWKALLFYRLEGSNAPELLTRMIDTIKLLKLQLSHGVNGQKEVRRLERRIAKNLFALNERATAYVDTTASALMSAVSSESDVNAFRDVLLELSTRIVALGSDFTVFEQVISYYQYLYKQRATVVGIADYESTLVSLDEILTSRLRS